MAETKLEIWSAALDRIGENDPALGETEDRPAVSCCARHYDRIRRMVLRDWPWHFAKAQSKLARPVDADNAYVTRVGWEYVYALPEDCLQPRALLGEGQRIGLITPDARAPFDICRNDEGDGTLLCCDLGPGDFEVLEYTSDVENPLIFSPDFEDALAWRLAVELAFAHKKDARLAQLMMQGFQGAITEAWASEMRGRQEDVEPEAASIRARR